MSKPTGEIGTYETGYWFLDKERETIHRTRPEVGFVFQLNTIESHMALHTPECGFWHSALIVTSAEEADGKTLCPLCFPETQYLQ